MGGCPPMTEIFYQSVSWFATESGGIWEFPQRHVLFWLHLWWDFVLHRWAGPRCDSSRQGKGCKKENSAQCEHFAAPPGASSGCQCLCWGLRVALPAECWAGEETRDNSDHSLPSPRILQNPFPSLSRGIRGEGSLGSRLWLSSLGESSGDVLWTPGLSPHRKGDSRVPQDWKGPLEML